MTESIGTAEEALAAILDTATRMGPIVSGLGGDGVPPITAPQVNEARQQIIYMVQMALADLHHRPQGQVEYVPLPDPGVDTVRELALDYAVKVLTDPSIAVEGTPLADWTVKCAEQFARFLAGGPING